MKRRFETRFSDPGAAPARAAHPETGVAQARVLLIDSELSGVGVRSFRRADCKTYRGFMLPILVIDDDKNMRLSLESILSGEGRAVQAVESAEAALDLLEREEFLMVITDVRLGGMNGYELLKRIRTRWPDLPVVLITAYATPRLAAEAIKAGAFDYLPKPFAPEELLNLVGKCAERHRLLTENRALREHAGELYRLDQLIGECPQMHQLRELIQTIAPTDARVLILGESGTGKELVAGIIHALSRRRDAGYVRINCAAIPETLLESELFGHEKGAFTGALRRKPGRVEEADGGTIFLDEIADMSKPLQAKLLRFLEDGTFTRVGGTQELKVDVRVIAATNKDIVKAIRDGTFREDLFHRLNVVQIVLPPLRQRGQDVVLLAEHFLRQYTTTMGKPIKGFAQDAIRKLLAHTWPGNVRELKNAVERAVILENTEYVRGQSLPDFGVPAQLHQGTAPAPDGNLDRALSSYERELIMSALQRHGYSLSRAASALGISRHALRYRMQRLGIEANQENDPEDAGPTDTPTS